MQNKICSIKAEQFIYFEATMTIKEFPFNKFDELIQNAKDSETSDWKTIVQYIT